MTRTILTTNLGENLLRHTVRIEADPSPENDWRALATFLQTVVAYTPDMMRHIGPCPESGRFFYDDGRWVLETTTIVARPNEE